MKKFLAVSMVIVLSIGIMSACNTVDIVYDYEEVVLMPMDTENIVPEWDNNIIPGALNGEIVVNGEIIDAPAPFWARGSEYFDGGTHATTVVGIYLPIHEVAEALGMVVNWNDLPSEAIIFDDVAFVMHDFFGFKGGMSSIEIYNGQVLINQ